MSVAAQDPYGNYEPLIDDPSDGYQSGSGHDGVGSPEGVFPGPVGWYYVDTSTGDLYVKVTGTGNTGWVLVTGGGGGATEVYFGTGDPNGVQTATRPALFYTAAGDVWVKTGAGTTNTGWEQLIAAP